MSETIEAPRDAGSDSSVFAHRHDYFALPEEGSEGALKQQGKVAVRLLGTLLGGALVANAYLADWIMTESRGIGDLSAALIEQRRFNEAIEILARAVKDNPSEKRLTDMLAVATKFRNQARDRTLMFAPRLTGQYGVVEDLLRERMPEEGFHSEQIDSAIRLWRDFTCGTELRFSSPGSWAAAVEYTISKLDRDARVTQKFVATKYGVSVSAVSTKFKRIWHGLGVKDFDVRYSSHKDYFEKLFQERDSTDKE